MLKTLQEKEQHLIEIEIFWNIISVFTVNVGSIECIHFEQVFILLKKRNFTDPKFWTVVYINHLNTVHIYVNMTKVKETNLLVQILEINWM